jgi:hypothetical protein
MNKVDVIILSLAEDDKSFETTKRCVDSYIETADELIEKIYVIESYKDFNKNYNHKCGKEGRITSRDYRVSYTQRL